MSEAIDEIRGLMQQKQYDQARHLPPMAMFLLGDHEFTYLVAVSVISLSLMCSHCLG